MAILYFVIRVAWIIRGAQESRVLLYYYCAKTHLCRTLTYDVIVQFIIPKWSPESVGYMATLLLGIITLSVGLYFIREGLYPE